MAPKVQGTRNDSIHRVPPSFLSAKTLQHCKHTGLNQAYFTRSLIINTFFASLPGVNFIRKKARVCGSIASLLYAVCLYRAYGCWILSLHIYIMNSWCYLMHTLLCSTTSFSLILLLNITPEHTLHSRVKDSITHNSIVIWSSNFNGRLKG